MAQFFVFLLFYNWKFFLPNIDQILQLCQDNFPLRAFDTQKGLLYKYTVSAELENLDGLQQCAERR